MENNFKIKLLRLYGVCNSFSLFISGIFGIIEINNNNSNCELRSDYIINIYSLIGALLLLYFEINNTYLLEDILFKIMAYIFYGILILGTSKIGLIIGSINIFYGIANVFIYYLIKNNKLQVNNINTNITHSNINNQSEEINELPSNINNQSEEINEPPINYEDINQNFPYNNSIVQYRNNVPTNYNYNYNNSF